MSDLDGQVAVVTGGASGIGEATVKLFAEQGARVLIADMQRERGESLAASLGDSARFVQVEVSQEDDVQRAIAGAVDAWGRLDCIFNNAGFGGVLGPLEDIPVEEFDLTMNVLVRGVYLGIKHAIPVMKSQGSGSIINTGSIAGVIAGRGPLVYSIAKAAVIHMTKTVSMELAPHNVRVNCICPGYIATPLSANTVGKPDALIEERISEYEHRQPIPKAGRPRDIAELALWLASGRSAFVTGQSIVVDGGATVGVPWENQNPVYRQYRPVKIYRPQS